MKNILLTIITFPIWFIMWVFVTIISLIADIINSIIGLYLIPSVILELLEQVDNEKNKKDNNE